MKIVKIVAVMGFGLILSCTPVDLDDYKLNGKTAAWVKGTVSDADTGGILSEAKVYVNNVLKDTVDPFGRYVVALESVTAVLTVKNTGYYDWTTNMTFQSGVTNTLNVAMDPVSSLDITIVTFNVEDFSAYNSYTEVAEFIVSSNVDVIVFEEVQVIAQTQLANALSVLGSDLTNFGYSSSGGYGGDYLAYWTRWPTDSEADLLTGTLTDPVSSCSYDFGSLRPIFRFRVNVVGNYIWFYAGHLKAEANCDGTGCYSDSCIKRRRAQAAALESYIKAGHDEENEYIVILGDMNTAQSTDFASGNTVDMLTLKSDNPGNTANDFIDVNYTLIPGSYTYPGYNSLLDHIILSPALYAKYVAGSVAVPHPAGNPSDHYPVILRVNLE